MVSNSWQRRPERETLKPSELAEAAILADLALVVVVVTRLTPLSAFTQVLGCLPFAILAMRHRLKVVGVGFWIAFILTFLLAGYGQALKVIVMVVWGSIVGRSIRNKWGWGRTLLWSMTLGWATTSIITLGLVYSLSRFRELWLEVIGNQWEGISQILSLIVDLANSATGFFQTNPLLLVGVSTAVVVSQWRESKRPVLLAVTVLVIAAAAFFAPTIPANWISTLDTVVETGIDKWWISVPVAEFVFGLWMTHIVRRLGTPVGNQIQRTFGPADTSDSIDKPSSTPNPVPISLAPTMVRTGDIDLYEIDDLRIDPGEFVVLTGANGAGKSTLLKILAGIDNYPSLTRPGDAGLGEQSGTALIGQRPESQVLGARVIDDLRWGLQAENGNGNKPSTAESEALTLAGLSGFELRETSTLSGGELQRLVIAGAILRNPKLVLSDESTSMLSPDGRVRVMELLRSFADSGSAVVHITHIETELEYADRVLRIENNMLVEQ